MTKLRVKESKAGEDKEGGAENPEGAEGSDIEKSTGEICYILINF